LAVDAISGANSAMTQAMGGFDVEKVRPGEWRGVVVSPSQ
jgi:hypothetical protein